MSNTFSRINFRITIKTATDIIPANAGEANHEPPRKIIYYLNFK